MSEPLYCYSHPDRETLLRCGRCERPICAECAIRHPVGLRCPSCAQLRKAPTYDVPAHYYAIALGAGLGASLLCGLAAEILPRYIPIFYFSILWALAAGALVGEAISRATGRKRGRGLQVVAGISVLVGTFAATLLIAAFTYGAATLVLLPVILLNPYYWLYPIAATVVAVIRLR